MGELAALDGTESRIRSAIASRRSAQTDSDAHCNGNIKPHGDRSHQH